VWDADITRGDLTLAKRFADEGRLEVAARLFRRLLEDRSRTLVEAEVESGFFRPVRFAVERAIRDGGPELLEQYLRVAEPTAGAIMPEASDASPEATEALRRITKEFFLTSYGDDAAYRLAQRELDQQRWFQAARLLSRLPSHPDPSLDLTEVRLRLALAWSRLSRPDRARELVEEAGVSTDAASPILRALAKELERDGADLRGQGASAYPHTLVDPTRRGRLDAGTVDDAAIADQLWAVEYTLDPLEVRMLGSESRVFPLGDKGNIIRNDPVSLGSHWRDTRQLPAGTVVFSETGEAYFRSLRELVCVELSTGEVRWRAREWSPVVDRPDPSLSRLVNAPKLFVDGQFLTQPNHAAVQVFSDRASRRLTYIDGAVYQLEGGTPYGASNLLKQIESNGKPFAKFDAGGVLASYDGVTGELRWRRSVDSMIPDPTLGGSFASLPVAYDGMLLVATEVQGQVEVIALDPVTGATLRRTAVGLTPYRSLVGDLMMIAVDGETAYVSTGQGLVAAIDARAGETMWSRSYPRQSSSPESAPGWEENAVMPEGGVLYVTPSDARRLLVIDALTGEIMASQDAGDWRYPLGVVAGDLLLASTSGLDRYDTITGDIAWRSNFREPVSGRGVMVGDTAYMPVADRIERVDLATGEQGRAFEVPAFEGQPVGNLYASRGQMVMLGVGVVRGFGDVDRWTDQMERLAESGDVSVLLHRARIRFNAGEVDAGLESLRIAMRNARGSARAATVRSRLLAALTAAAVSRPWRQAEPLLNEAASLAKSTNEGMLVRLARVDSLKKSRRPGDAAEALAPLLSAEAAATMRYADGRRINTVRLAADRMRSLVEWSRAWLTGTGDGPRIDAAVDADAAPRRGDGSPAVLDGPSNETLPDWSSTPAVEPWWSTASSAALEAAKASDSIDALWSVHEAFSGTPAGTRAAEAAIDRAIAGERFAMGELLAERLGDDAIKADAYQRIARAMAEDDRLAAATRSAWRRVAELAPARLIEGRPVSEILADHATPPLAPEPRSEDPAERLRWERAWSIEGFGDAWFVELAPRPGGPSEWMRDKQLFVGGGELGLLSLTDGQTIWARDLPGDGMETSVANGTLVAVNGISISSGGLANDGGVLMLASKQGLAAIDLYMGITLWEAPEQVPMQQADAATRSYGLTPVHASEGYAAAIVEAAPGAASDWELVLYDLATGTCLWRTPIDTYSVGSRMGGVRIVGDSVHTLNIEDQTWIAYDRVDGRERLRKAVKAKHGAFGRQTLSVITTGLRRIVGYNLDDGTRMYVTRSPSGPVHDVRSADASAFGGWMLVCSETRLDRNFREWQSHVGYWVDIESGRITKELTMSGQSSSFQSMAISRDGKRVVAVGESTEGEASNLQAAIGIVDGKENPAVRFVAPQETGPRLTAAMLAGGGDFFAAIIRDRPRIDEDGESRPSSGGTVLVLSPRQGGIVPGMALPTESDRPSYFENLGQAFSRAGMLVVMHGGDRLTGCRLERGQPDEAVDLTRAYNKVVNDLEDGRKAELLDQVRRLAERRNEVRLELVKASINGDADREQIRKWQGRIAVYGVMLRRYRERGYAKDVNQILKEFDKAFNEQRAALRAQRNSD